MSDKRIDPQQEFVPLFGYEKSYAINRLGEIKRTGAARGARVGHILKTHAHKSRGYLTVRLYEARIGRTHDVHILVARTFIGQCPDGMQVCHDDGKHTNCQRSNLRYDTPKGNCADKVRHGTENTGTRNGRAKYTEAQITAVKRSLLGGESAASVARKTGMPPTTVRNIKNGYRWAWL